MRVGDEVEVDGVRGKVRATSDAETLDWTALETKYGKRKGRGYWIGVSQIGNPRVKVVKRNGGRELPLAEWSDA